MANKPSCSLQKALVPLQLPSSLGKSAHRVPSGSLNLGSLHEASMAYVQHFKRFYTIFIYSKMYSRHGKSSDFWFVCKVAFSLSVCIMQQAQLKAGVPRRTATNTFYFCLKSENLWPYCLSPLTANINLCNCTQADLCSGEQQHITSVLALRSSV